MGSNDEKFKVATRYFRIGAIYTLEFVDGAGSCVRITVRFCGDEGELVR